MDVDIYVKYILENRLEVESTLSLFHLGIKFSRFMLCQCVCVLG